MRIRNIVRIAAAAALAMMPLMASAQTSSINTYSLYTLYGLGDFHIQGSTHLRSMGGASTAYRSFNISAVNGIINYTNPASLSATPRQSFHFNFGLEGSNHFLSTTDRKTSFNTFNIRDIAFQMPITQRLAVGVSLTPFSSVGYRTESEETDPDVLAALLQGNATGVKYLFDGNGDINQAKFSLGWEPVKNLSIGFDAIYYFGRLNRNFTTAFLSGSSSAGYVDTQVLQTERISRIMWNLGMQYNIISDTHRQLTFGATYNVGGKLNPTISTTVINSLSIVQPIESGLTEQFELPSTISAGVFYQTWRTSVGFDYTYQGWSGINRDAEVAGTDSSVDMKFRNTSALRAGIEFTPSRTDVRRLLNRFTYRAGVRYSDYYMKFNDTGIKDMGVSLGVGMPFRYESRSYIDIGIEYGRRGATKNNLIKEDYFKVSVGFRLFGSDNWFAKRKFD